MKNILWLFSILLLFVSAAASQTQSIPADVAVRLRRHALLTYMPTQSPHNEEYVAAVRAWLCRLRDGEGPRWHVQATHRHHAAAIHASLRCTVLAERRRQGNSQADSRTELRGDREGSLVCDA